MPRILVAFLGFAIAWLALAAHSSDREVTISGVVDLAELVERPRYTVRALMPQDPTVEFATAKVRRNGSFEVVVDESAFRTYGVLLEAVERGDSRFVLQRAVLDFQALDSADLNPAETVKSAILGWRIARYLDEFDRVRPFPLNAWLEPLRAPQAASLDDAALALYEWAVNAAGSAKSDASRVLRAAVGDPRALGHRLSPEGVEPAAIALLQELSRTRSDVAYLLMMPYVLEW